MRKRYLVKCLAFTSILFLLLTVAESCKKDSSNKNTTVTTVQAVTPATPVTLGLYGADSAMYRQLLIGVATIGTKNVGDYLVFDTGSGGMVIDATGIVPASMITGSGFNFTGDSTVVDGITITNKKLLIEYGADDSTLTKVYGNLAYAPVTVGDENGTIDIKRIPFFLYFKAVDANGDKLGPHEFDTFGVSSEYIVFSADTYIASPFSYYDPGTGLTRGFKMATLALSDFSFDGTYVPNEVTLGLTASDLSPSTGFVMNSLNYNPEEGYDPTIPSAVNYNSVNFSTDALYDTGTGGYNYIENAHAASEQTLLPQKTNVSLAANTGFNYNYTVEPDQNLTYIVNAKSGAEFSVMSIDFFLANQYMMDYTDHKLGLQNN